MGKADGSEGQTVTFAYISGGPAMPCAGAEINSSVRHTLKFKRSIGQGHAGLVLPLPIFIYCATVCVRSCYPLNMCGTDIQRILFNLLLGPYV
jgi:hypothetical protein